MSIDQNLFQIIATSDSHTNITNVGKKYFLDKSNDVGVDIRCIHKTYIVFVDNPAKAPKDCVYYIKIFEQIVVGKRWYYYGMDWDDNMEEEIWDKQEDEPTLVYEFSIYNTLDETPDFYTHISANGISLKYTKMTQDTKKFKGTTSKDKYMLQFTNMFEQFSKPPSIPEKKECIHMGRKKKK
jgi:hypothetical protein